MILSYEEPETPAMVPSQVKKLSNDTWTLEAA